MNDHTPVLIGIGEFSERPTDSDYAALSPVEIAARAAAAAIADAGAVKDLAGRIDAIAAVRKFEDVAPRFGAPFGKSNNFPRSIAERIGADPRFAIYDITGGQTPQALVAEFCERIAVGEFELGLLVGGEAISTARYLAAQGLEADWSETIDAPVEDRGPQVLGLTTRNMLQHRLLGAPKIYALLENARRARLGMTSEAYRVEMATLFAPFSDIASCNPHSMSHDRFSAEELAQISRDNRLIADPYPRRLVSRDQVNQGAALLLCSTGKARALGIDLTRAVYLHGYASLVDHWVMNRPDLSRSDAAEEAARAAIRNAGIDIASIRYLDLYSCFPIAVSVVAEALGLAPNDPRALTLTGGLPFFGGAGNNYSMHAICSLVERLRDDPGAYGFIGANGGMLSKYAAGVYSSTAKAFVRHDMTPLQREIDARRGPPLALRPQGAGRIETYTILYEGGVATDAVIVGRLNASGERFLANPAAADGGIILAKLLEADPIGQAVHVYPTPEGNRFAFDPARLAGEMPSRGQARRSNFEHIDVRVDGHVLEVTINRPASRNALHTPAHLELDEIFDYFEADADLWVCILTGAGAEAFCSGNDLKYTASGKPMLLPKSGWGGLTLRRDRTKPIIAAANGFALGGGLEMCLACDIVVVDQSVQMGLSEVRVGLVAAAGGLVRLPRQIPAKLAADMILTARRLNAEEALAHGLASRVAPAGEALACAREVAAEILKGAPLAVRASLAVMGKATACPDTGAAVNLYYPEIEEVLSSEDFVEGVQAFAQKRVPRWTGR